MLSLTEINEIRALIMSDRCTFKGNEIAAVTGVLSALAREEAAAKQALRVTPRGAAPTPQEVIPPPVTDEYVRPEPPAGAGIAAFNKMRAAVPVPE
jgi:hypothetical protein